MAGRVAVVTGGSGGLGEAISLALSDNGVHVASIDRDAEANARLSGRLSDDGAEHLVVTGDVREPDKVEALFKAAHDRWGRIDVLVNVVGGTFKSAFSDQT